MDTVAVTTVADVRRYHRHLDRAVKAGFSADAEGLQAYKQFVKAKRSQRALQSSSLTLQQIMSQTLTQNYRDALVLPGAESRPSSVTSLRPYGAALVSTISAALSSRAEGVKD